jgi:hypothetical protein
MMLNVRKGKYHSVNPVGARIWELLETPTSEAALVDRLTEEFEVTREVCGAEVHEFLAMLRDRALITGED